jgi:hypothetical protein
VLALPYLTRLRELELRYEPVSDDDARHIASCPHLSGLTSLDVCSDLLTDAGAVALIESPVMTRLTYLWVGGAQVSPPLMASLAQRFGPKKP